MSESVIYDARFLCDVHLSSLRASSHCLNLHPISPWPRPWTQTSPSAKTTLRSKTACGMTAILIDDSVQPCFSMSVANDVFSDGNIKGSGCKPETDEMTDVDVKARFQTDTTGNSSNQILKISDSDIARGVFYVFFLDNLLVFYSVTSDGPISECVHRI